MKKDKSILVLLLAVLIIVGGVMIYFSFKKDVVTIPTDAQKIKNEFASLNNQLNENNQRMYPLVNLTDDNLFVYKTEEEIIKIIEESTGVIFFGNSSDAYTRTLMPIVDNLSKKLNLEQVYYFDITTITDTIALDDLNEPIIKEKGSSGYYKILKLLDEQLPNYYLTSPTGEKIDTLEKRIEVPTILAVKNGKIKDIYMGTIASQKSGYDKLTTEEEKQIEENLEKLMKNALNNTCSSEQAC